MVEEKERGEMGKVGCVWEGESSGLVDGLDVGAQGTWGISNDSQF